MKTKFLLAFVPLFLLTSGLPASAQPAPLPPALSTSAGWRWPLDSEPTVLEPFDKPAQNWLPGHRGIDLTATEGDSVVAPQRGRVAFASVIVDRPVLVIDHGYGFKTSLEPVSATVDVGDWVEAGASIGEVATGAHCSGRCIHWGVRLDGEYIDPALLVEDLRPSILLPWEE